MNNLPTTPLRVLQVTGNLDRGGVETWVKNFYKYSQGSGLQMDVLVVSPDPHPGAYESEITALGGRIFRMPSTKNPLQFAVRAAQTLRQYGPYDIIHSHIHHFGGFVLLLARLLGIPVRIVTSHNDTSLADQTARGGRYAYLTLMRAAMQSGVTHRLAVSREAALALFGPDWKRLGTHITTLGIDLTGLRQQQDRASIIQELGLSASLPIIGHVGLFRQQKNHPFLLEIFAAYVRQYGAAQLLLIGDGPERPAIEARIRELGLTNRVHLLGSRPDVPALLGLMDVFVFPSFFEGLGLALIEAQGAGLRCVVSDVVPKEAAQIEGAVKFLPLSAPAEVWAAAIHRAVSQGKIDAQGLDFDVAVTSRELLSYYTQAREGQV